MMHAKNKFDPNRFFESELLSLDHVKNALETVFKSLGGEAMSDGQIAELHHHVNSKTKQNILVAEAIEKKVELLTFEEIEAILKMLKGKPGSYKLLPPGDQEFMDKHKAIFDQITKYTRGHTGNERRLFGVVLSVKEMIYAPGYFYVMTSIVKRLSQNTKATVDERRKLLPVKLMAIAMMS